MSKALILFLISLNAFAENHILFMGGGSEPEELETTIFDDEVKLMGRFLEKHKKTWKGEVSFNGGHSETEKHLAEGVLKVTPPNRPFTEKNFLDLIAEYERKIESGEIKSGDQLLVYITTHGAQKTDKEQTHKIGMSGKAATELDNLEGADLVSLDVLQGLITKAEQKGVKLGLMDFSCHSGAALALKNPNTCIITASGPNHFGYTSWGERFARNMWKGKNLEEIFLETFVDRWEPSFPMISTDTGVELQDELYELLTPYLHYWKKNDGNEKLSEFLETQIEKNQCEEADAKFSQLVKLTTDLESVFKSNKDELRDLRKAITEYHNFQKKMKDDLKKFGLVDLKTKKEKICSDRSDQSDSISITVCTEWTIENLMTLKFDDLKKHYLEMAEKAPTESQKDWYLASVENVEKARIRKEEILKENSSYAQYLDYYKNFEKLDDKTWELAMNVSKEIQKVYSFMYKEKAKKDKKSNPCKSFVL